MAQYIDKNALVAEIERQRKIYMYDVDNRHSFGRMMGYNDLLVFLDTLEVKEVDLDKEFDKYCANLYLIDLENEPYAELFECAKYFFELGLKTKGE